MTETSAAQDGKDRFRTVCRLILKEARKRDVRTVKQLNQVKMQILSEHPGIADIPNNADLLVCGEEEDRKALHDVLTMKPMRTISGVSPIAMMTDPYPCPHSMKGIGPCSYCPGGPGSPWGDVPQSYTGAEPSTRRSQRNHYDPYLGVINRLEHYLAMNHSPEKVEIILQGGTFTFFPKHYQEYFVKYLFKAMNDFSRIFYHDGELDFDRFTSFFELPKTKDDDARIASIHRKCFFLKNLDLSEKAVYQEVMDVLFDGKGEPANDKVKGQYELCFNGDTDLSHSDRRNQSDASSSDGSLQHDDPKRDGSSFSEGNPSKNGNQLNGAAKSEDPNVRAMKRVLDKLRNQDNKDITLEQVQEENERAKIRCVGLTVETKSDYARPEQAEELLRLGCTRVEIGVQTIYDDVLEKTNRGNTVLDNIKAFRTLKDLGFKINAHIMPGLPYTTEEKDKASLRAMFDDPSYRPDMLKIYPCMVMEGTRLHEQYRRGEFQPLSTGKAAELIAWFMQHIPVYCRVMRVQRDIPTFMTEDGVDKTNLRQYIDKEMRGQGITPRDIRAREPGHTQLHKGRPLTKPRTTVTEYEASEGKEFFIAYEDAETDLLYGYCRMRFPSRALRREITPSAAIIRELHVVGKVVPVGERGEIQHTGIGRKLMEKAEELAIARNKDKMVVISGVGVRDYYRKLGYVKEGPYMTKNLC